MTMTPAVLAGCEPFSSPSGTGGGALVIHGFTGNPASMIGLGKALAAAGFAVEVPRLPGHGTTVQDMATTSWADWSAHVERALVELSDRVGGPVLVAGLSMGGTLSAWLATQHPDRVRGLVLINAAVEPMADLMPMVAGAMAEGTEMFPAVGSDTKNGTPEYGVYDASPLRPLLSLLEAQVTLDLGAIRCPVLAIASAEDHVVPVTWADHLAAKLTAPLRRMELADSYHVATIDADAGRIEAEVVAFARELAA